MSEMQSPFGEVGDPTSQVPLTESDRDAIRMRADLRRRQQQLKVETLNLQQPAGTPERKAQHEHVLGLVFREVAGEESIDPGLAQQSLTHEQAGLVSKVTRMHELAPNLAAFAASRLAKLQLAAGDEYRPALEQAIVLSRQSQHLPKLVPSSLLPDAVILGIEARQTQAVTMPGPAAVARVALADPQLLQDYALVLPEAERESYLLQLPEAERQTIGATLDSTVAGVLHQSLVERGSSEETQRRAVRSRLYQELRDAVSQGDPGDRQLTKLIGQAIGSLGEDSRQLLLELIRDELETRAASPQTSEQIDYLPRVMKVLVDNFDDWRGNDLVLRTAADPALNHHLAIYLFGKLIDKGYLSKDIVQWWQDRRQVAQQQNAEPADERYRLAVLQSVVAQLGVMPNRDILTFVADERRWQKNGQLLSLAERLEAIRNSQAEFASITDNHLLVQKLAENEQSAMIYYLLHGGEDRFNLINNYDFAQFKEMLGLINQLEIHTQPLRRWQQALEKIGLPNQEAAAMVDRLSQGQFPLNRPGQDTQLVSFEASEQAALATANAEIGRVLGREQLGVILRYPLYREYLEAIADPEAQGLLAEMATATTFDERANLLDRIKETHPDFDDRVKADLQDNWVKFGEKMVIELGLNHVLTDPTVPVRGDELLPRLDGKRIDLKRIKKDLLVLLKGENKALDELRHDMVRKRRARKGLAEGLGRQTDPVKRAELESKIAAIDTDLAELDRKRAAIGEMKAGDRYAHLTETERQAEIENLSNEIIALTEKSPSAIFTYLTIQVLGEERLRESDLTLVRELESHLQGPFQTIADLKTYERPRTAKKRTQLNLQYLNKTDRLLAMVRFADSKICCFSSNNYEMRVQHDTPNKYWVASINADPLSFVISLEMPQEPLQRDQAAARRVTENLGFIFGNFGTDAEGQPALLMNGIYYAPGIEDSAQVAAILGGVEQMFAGLPIRTEAIASQHGGSVQFPPDYSNQGIELTRLRALDSGNGQPENHIYDDLGTGSDLNRPHVYGSHVWHKQFPQNPPPPTAG